jgi:TolB-like protein
MRRIPAHRARRPRSDRKDFKLSIAVLPFAGLSQQQGQGYFCEGIAEEICNERGRGWLVRFQALLERLS